jgi:polyprenyl-phospho-N-acetylgalactosaminyl synthase
MKVVGVMPAYNEAVRIGETVRACLPYVDLLVVVDDGSSDDTYRTAKDIGDPKLVVLHHRINRDQGAALRTGTEAALRLGADVVVHLDADGQHDPAEVSVLVAPIGRGEADVVLGSRFMGVAPKGMPLVRRALLKAARTFNTLALGIPRAVTDPQNGFRAMRAEAARQLRFTQDKKAHASEILRLATRSGFRWREVPVHVLYTAETLRKGNKTSDALRIAWQLFIGAFTN